MIERHRARALVLSPSAVYERPAQYAAASASVLFESRATSESNSAAAAFLSPWYVGDHSGAKARIRRVPPGRKPLEQRDESLPRVLVAIVVGRQVREQQQRGRGARVPGICGRETAKRRSSRLGIAERDLRSRALILRRGGELRAELRLLRTVRRRRRSAGGDKAPTRMRTCR